jgi:glycosyltransferase involved in cell wall biosynthesis
LNERLPEAIEWLRTEFSGLVPQDRIRVFELPGPVAELDLANTWRMQAAELIREKFLADLQPDIVHISTLFEGCHNEVVASVARLDTNIPTAVTLYDLIPLLRPDSYLQEPARERHYLRHAQSLKRADLLLAISASSAREATETLDVPQSRIVNIGAGVGDWFRPVSVSGPDHTGLANRGGLQEPFILFTGGTEPRKNLRGMIAAFARLPAELREKYQLVVTGGLTEQERERIAQEAMAERLAPRKIVFADYVTDEQLRILYNACALFVFPSLHEGFGLPVLEAMACGAPAIGSDCTSISEIIDRPDALFDPNQPADIARCMATVLGNPGLAEDLKAWGRKQASTFTWEASARKALDAFSALHEQRKTSGPLRRTTGRRPPLAVVGPLSPQHSPIADQFISLLPNLARHYEITCVVDKPEVTDPWITANFAIQKTAWFEENGHLFERILYQLDNSPLHKYEFALLSRYPGIVLLADLNIGNILDWMTGSGYKAGSFIRALYHSHGFSGLAHDKAKGRQASQQTFPCSLGVLQESIGVVATSTEIFEHIRSWYGEEATARIRQFPLEANTQPAGKTNPSNGQETFRADRTKAGADQRNRSEQTADLCRDLIEELYQSSWVQREQQLVRAIRQITTSVVPNRDDLATVATVIAGNRPRETRQQILIDVSLIAKDDLRTGIQRVTRALLMTMLAEPPAGYRIEPVRADNGGYVYARRYACQCLGLSATELDDEPVETNPDDIFVGLDWCPETVPALRPWFRKQRRRGLRIVFVSYDLLPLLRPELFAEGMYSAATDWIRSVSEIADGITCISRTVADEFYQWLSRSDCSRQTPLSIGFFHLGADLHASVPTKGLTPDAASILVKLRSRPSFLMVGTLEPRKGHRQALAAMEGLWSEGVDTNLVIVGKEGWMMEDFIKGVRQHPENNRRLFWLRGISDEMLDQVYRSSRALLAASEGEGFGLPLIEASQYGLPIIVRDIPIFREVAGENAYYFRANKPEDLADALQKWLSLGDAVPYSQGLSYLTWQQSSCQLLDFVFGRRQYRSWPEPAARLPSKLKLVDNLTALSRAY